MAFSNRDRIFKLEQIENGVIPYKREAPRSGEKVPLYIPRLMPNITMGVPKDSKVPSKGTGVFKNDPSCPIKADTVMTSSNCLKVKFEGNSKWVSKQDDVTSSKKSNASNDKLSINVETGTRTVSSGMNVTIHAESNVVQDMTFINK